MLAFYDTPKQKRRASGQVNGISVERYYRTFTIDRIKYYESEDHKKFLRMDDVYYD